MPYFVVLLMTGLAMGFSDPPYARVELPLAEANQLAMEYHFSGVGIDDDGALIVSGSTELLALFDDLNIPYTLMIDRYLADQEEAAFWKSVPSSYFNPTTLLSWLQSLVASHSSIAELVQIGTTDLARPIWAVKVTDNLMDEEFEPELRIIGNIHGDEKSSLMVCTDALEWILTQYGIHPDATKLVNETEMWFVPMVNPDGNFAHTRSNSNGVDLNRDFDGPAGPGTVFPAFSQKETQAIRDMTEVLGNRFMLGLTFHSGAACFNSVWNYTTTGPPDLANFFSSRTGGSPCSNPGGECAIPAMDGLAEAYGQGCTYPNFWQVVGADWYVTFGDTNDWAYDEWGTLDTTLECTVSKTPSESQIPIYTAQHRFGVINYLLKSRQGIEGVITDAVTGDPLDAQLTVTEFPQTVFTDPILGDYHRFAVPGTYEITASAQGYTPKTLTDITVTVDVMTLANFQLLPDSITFEYLVEIWHLQGPIDTNGNDYIDVIDLLSFL